jgi:hypothetical protein
MLGVSPKRALPPHIRDPQLKPVTMRHRKIGVFDRAQCARVDGSERSSAAPCSRNPRGSSYRLTKKPPPRS